jgi:hypothetical protein
MRFGDLNLKLSFTLPVTNDENPWPCVLVAVPSPTMRPSSTVNAEIVPIENGAVAATVALSGLTIGQSACSALEWERTAAYLAGVQVGCSFGRGYSVWFDLWLATEVSALRLFNSIPFRFHCLKNL